MNRYRVEMWLEIGTWLTYTARNKPLSREEANAYAEGLKRQGQPGRIVDATSRAVIESWQKSNKEEVMVEENRTRRVQRHD